MAFFRFQGVARNAEGPAIPGVEVFVCTQPLSSGVGVVPPAPLANIYAGPSSNGASLTSASFSGGFITLVFTSTPPSDVLPGSFINLTGVNPSGYNAVWQVVSVSGNNVVVETPYTTFAPNPGTYVSGGSVATSALPNPLLTDGNGNFFFYATTGTYTLVYFDPANRIPTTFAPDQQVVTQGGGSVTSVAATAPAGFSFSGSPITGAGTLALAFTSDWNANTFLAGPASGSASTPTRRALVAADLAGISGIGTVTSVAVSFTATALFTVTDTGGPITTNGTIALTLDFANQPANTFLAGPTSGGSGALSARAIVAADLPGALIQSVVTTLSSAQLLALLGTPIQLVPAPGAGLTIVPLAIVIEVLGGSAAYTDAGGAVQLTIGSAILALGSNAVFTTPLSNNQIQRLAGFAATDTAAAPPTDVNAAMQIQKITNNFAAGNGTAKVTVLYTTVAAT